LLLKEEEFAKHKFVHDVAPKEEVVASWGDLIVPLAIARLEMLLSLSLQQLPNL
jgi:hypothetical protein